MIKGLVGLFQDNYNGFSNKTFIVNASKSFTFLWNLVKGMIPEKTQGKVIFVKQGEEKILCDHMCADSLEKRYGGNLENITGDFWPPPEPKEHAVTRRYLAEKKIPVFWLVDNETDGNLFKVERNNKIDLSKNVSKKLSIVKKASMSMIVEKPKKNVTWFESLFGCCCSNRDGKKNRESIRNEVLVNPNNDKLKLTPQKNSASQKYLDVNMGWLSDEKDDAMTLEKKQPMKKVAKPAIVKKSDNMIVVDIVESKKENGVTDNGVTDNGVTDNGVTDNGKMNGDNAEHVNGMNGATIEENPKINGEVQA